jgi:hypothetical protein
MEPENQAQANSSTPPPNGDRSTNSKPRRLKDIGERIIARLESIPPEERERRAKEAREVEEYADRAMRADLLESFLAERGKRYRDCQVSTYEVYDDAQRVVIEKLRQYCEWPPLGLYGLQDRTPRQTYRVAEPNRRSSLLSVADGNGESIAG